MTPGLYVLAFDHRASLMRSFFRVEGEPGPAEFDRARLAKLVIWEGLARALERGLAKESVAALVDATYGGDAIDAAKGAGVRVAVPVEASGRDELTFEHDDWRERLASLDPTWAKVLIRYNPDGDQAMNERQRTRLLELGEECRRTERPLMLELLVPAEPRQRSASFDDDVRPGLMARAIEELRGSGIGADLWKIEGLDRREDCERVASAAGAPCVVLGRGEDRDAVDRWLRAAGGVAGYVGFAIGRSIWWDALRAFFLSESDGEARAAAANAIAGEYLRYVEVAEASA